MKESLHMDENSKRTFLRTPTVAISAWLTPLIPKGIPIITGTCVSLSRQSCKPEFPPRQTIQGLEETTELR